MKKKSFLMLIAIVATASTAFGQTLVAGGGPYEFHLPVSGTLTLTMQASVGHTNTPIWNASGYGCSYSSSELTAWSFTVRCPGTYPVIYAGTVTDVTVYAYVPTSSLSVSTLTMNFGSSGGSSSASVSSNVSWSASSDASSWLSVSPSSGSNNGSVNVTASANSSTSPRNGTITVSGGGLSETISVTQDGAPATYTVTVTGGTASPSSGPTGTVVTLTPGTPPSGKQFKQWNVLSGGVSVSGNTLTIGSANVSVEAVWEDIPVTTYTVTVTGGTASPSSGPTGTVVTLTPGTPPSGKQFKQWNVLSGGVSVSGNTLTIGSANVSVEAIWEDVSTPTTYTITPSAGTGGTISPSTVQTVNQGGSQMFTATPSSGKEVDQWFVNGSAVQNGGTSYTVSNVQANVTVNVTFKDTPVITYYTVTVSSAGSGASGGGSYAAGATVNISAGTAPTGQQFKNWTSSPSVSFTNANSPNTSFTMPGNAVTVTANFEPIPTTPTLTVSPPSLSFIAGGESKSFTITSNTSWTVSSNQTWASVSSTSGSNNGSVNVTTTANTGTSQRTATITISGTGVTAQTVTVTQDGTTPTPTLYPLTVVNGTGGGSYEAGDIVIIMAHPASQGEEFDKWIITSGGGSFANANSATTDFTMPSSAVTVTATYKDAVANESIEASSMLKAWTQNGVLHVSGLMPGESWGVYSLTGVCVYTGIATGGEATLALPGRGVYVLKTGGYARKVVN